ncbi:unnamed protein product [Aureobasidium vineae]|uniref:PLP-dependent transferase n=1 Tax=Aureobasidium vineae TaxID=2773715 RepID=A0A9N8J893_9PEZI|nr:unnamed protein product [Aureobasidium vineae]
MPRELKKRGRRGEEKKRKLEEEEEVHQEFAQPKRQRTEDDGDEAAEQQDFVGLPQDGAYTNGDYQNGEGQGPPVEQVFFGMLDEEEQEYFKRADEMLEMNNFADAEERSLFLANVYREANGKELKIANSQSCSRLMERLIQLSTPAQLKTLFQKFSGNFMHLFQHRFASHCCEKLFIQAAPAVTEELLHPPKVEDQTTADGDVYVSMENLFLFTLGEMEGNVGFLMTDRFASHTLRVLLLVLAGEPLSDSTNKSLMQSKKKEHVTVNGSSNDKEDVTTNDKEDRRPVPKSFTEALEKLMTASVSGLDTTSLRALATHQLGNPALQLLIRLELTHFGKSKAKDENSIFRTLLPDDPITPECDSASFINGLLFDPIGSHLIECIVEHAPGKMFKSLYRGLLKDRIASLARNEIACYVACKVLERLSKDDLLEAHEQICPQIPSLLERNRFAVIKTLIARCAVREIDSQAIAVQLSEAYNGPEGFDIVKLLKPETDEAATNGNPAPEGMPAHIAEERANPHTIKLQGSLLAQCMILVPGALSALVLESLASLAPSTLQKMASDTIICRTLQAAMTSHNASIISRRKLIQQFFGHIGEMALDSKASRVVDAIWEGTHGLAFIRERIAEELNENEAALRDNPAAAPRRGEWVKQSKIKASNDGFQSFSEVDTNLKAANEQNTHANKKTWHANQQASAAPQAQGGEKKSAIQLARERHAANKARSQQAREKHVAGGSRPSGSSNSSKHAPAEEKPLQRADEVNDLLNSIQELIIPFIRSADEDAATKHTGHGLAIEGQGPRTALVEYHPPNKLKSLFDVQLPESSAGKEGLLDVVQKLLKYSVNTWDQGFMDKLYASTNAVGVVSELLLAVLNTNLHVYQVSPALTIMEKTTSKALAKLFGFGGAHGGGISQPGGSASNATSIAIARNTLHPETKTDGINGRRFTLFTSAHGHYSLEKAAQMFGFGSSAVIGVAVDKQGRMLPSALDEAVQKSKDAGEVPFYVNATAGTTVLGSYDPIGLIADVCQKHKLWLHIDGSWGGPVIFSATHKHKLEGVERADSIGVTPHKMLSVPMTCSFLLGKDMRQFQRAMTLPAGYLFHSDEDEDASTANTTEASTPDVERPEAEIWDLADLTPQCGRRGDALKLALSWIYYGSSGFEASIDAAFSAASTLADLVSSNPAFSLVSENPPPCWQVCFYYNKQSGAADKNSKITESITKKLIPRGFMVDYAPGEEGKFFRVVVNPATRRGTLEGLVKAIEEIGGELKV